MSNNLEHRDLREAAVARLFQETIPLILSKGQVLWGLNNCLIMVPYGCLKKWESFFLQMRALS